MMGRYGFGYVYNGVPLLHSTYANEIAWLWCLTHNILSKLQKVGEDGMFCYSNSISKCWIKIN